jgi:membrane protein DedA with SNARE-associated domain
VPSWVSGAMGMPFRQFALWNVPAAFLWMVTAALAAYGVGSAVSGGSLVDALVPLLVATAAFAILVFVFMHWRRRHAAAIRP